MSLYLKNQECDLMNKIVIYVIFFFIVEFIMKNSCLNYGVKILIIIKSCVQ